MLAITIPKSVVSRQARGSAGTSSCEGRTGASGVRPAWASRGPGEAARRAGVAALGVGIAAVLVIPVAWALSSVVVKGVAVLPAADLVRLGPDAQTARAAASTPASIGTLVDFLRRNRQDERYLLATTGTRLAAPIIIETGEPVMAMGGFAWVREHGTLVDPLLWRSTPRPSSLQLYDLRPGPRGAEPARLRTRGVTCRRPCSGRRRSAPRSRSGA